MVAKRIAGVAGSVAGGFLNNPGALAAVGIAITIITTLLIFRNDIRSFFSNISEGFGQITLPEITLPSFPDITFPSLPDITFPTFEFPDINITFPSFEDIFMVPEPFVEPERMDVPFPTEEDPDKVIDIVPDVTGGRGERLAGVIGDTEFEAEVPRDVLSSELFALTTFGEGSVRVEQEQTLAEPRPEISFAESIVEETQAGFQERAAAAAEAFPERFESTSLRDDVIFGRQLSRDQEDFESVLEAEARRSESIFALLFGNVQNPEFGA